jgi:uncharacterized protein
MTIRSFILSVGLIIVSMCAAYSQDVGYKSMLTKMFSVSGSEETYKSAIRQMFVMFKQQSSDVPDEVWADLEKEFLQTSMDDLVDMLAPVYEKHLTLADLQKLIEFYETPAGVKFAQKTPFIMQESMQAGQQWGEKIGQDFQRKLKEKGY